MEILQALAVVVLLQSLSLSLACGPSPPPSCSWDTCKQEWRDDWEPGVQLECCTTQKRSAHDVYTTHNGEGSCPETAHCTSKNQSRIKLNCTEDAPLGFQNGTIKDAAFSASSHYKSYPPSLARLNTAPGKAWYAEPWDVNKPWIKIDLGRTTFVSAVACQGKRYSHFVKSYRVKYSEDNKNWHTYGKELSGNTNYFSVVKRTFDRPLYARYIQIEPTKWNKNGIAMKLEVYKCIN